MPDLITQWRKEAQRLKELALFGDVAAYEALKDLAYTFETHADNLERLTPKT